MEPMITSEISQHEFTESIEYARRIARKVLSTDLAGFTSDDIVAVFLERAHKRGNSEAEIIAMIYSPKIYGYFKNIRTEFWRLTQTANGKIQETAESLDEVEYWLASEQLG